MGIGVNLIMELLKHHIIRVREGAYIITVLFSVKNIDFKVRYNQGAKRNH